MKHLKNKQKYFKKNFFWNESLKKFIGLPRPSYLVPEKFYKRYDSKLPLVKNFYLHKQVPVPFQSRPVFKEEGLIAFNLIIENEHFIYKNNICPYCATIIEKKEICVRWIGEENYKIQPKLDSGPRVFSDLFPFHIECMQQARIFCPFMRFINEERFEYGLYEELRKKAEQHLKQYE